ncbi:MAG: hypothetical protein HY702_02710 [Gemmatimonadetes bacterium]|nr:hypothetical protein [Gemmatimonadota bacterium]
MDPAAKLIPAGKEAGGEGGQHEIVGRIARRLLSQRLQKPSGPVVQTKLPPEAGQPVCKG